MLLTMNDTQVRRSWQSTTTKKKNLYIHKTSLWHWQTNPNNQMGQTLNTLNNGNCARIDVVNTNTGQVLDIVSANIGQVVDISNAVN